MSLTYLPACFDFFRECDSTWNREASLCIDNVNARTGELGRQLLHGLLFCVESSPIPSCFLADTLKNRSNITWLVITAQKHNLFVQIRIFHFWAVLSVVQKCVTHWYLVEPVNRRRIRRIELDCLLAITCHLLGFFFSWRSFICFNTRFVVLVEWELRVDGVELDGDIFIFFWTGVLDSCFVLFDFTAGDFKPCFVLPDFFFLVRADEDVFFFLRASVGCFWAAFIDFLLDAPGISSISIVSLLLAWPVFAWCFGLLLRRLADTFCGADFFSFVATPSERGGTIDVVGGADFPSFLATRPDNESVDVLGNVAFFFFLTPPSVGTVKAALSIVFVFEVGSGCVKDDVAPWKWGWCVEEAHKQF